jgi:hypothetical protein
MVEMKFGNFSKVIRENRYLLRKTTLNNVAITLSLEVL